MPHDPRLSPLAALVRRHDPDRFLATLFAPAARREALFALYAFNHELARAREAAREPTMALIRLQWWRETVEGTPRRHEVAAPLAAVIAQGGLVPAELLAMIEGREAEAEPEIATLAEWCRYLDATAGALAVAAARALQSDPALLPRIRALGAAYGAAGVLRSVPALAAQGRCLLPADVLAAHGLTAEAVIAGKGGAALAPVLATLAAEGRALLAAGRGALPRAAIAAALPAVLARRDLRRPGAPPRPRGLADRLAMLAAALAGRV